jgi:hypothetical protein
MSVTYVGASTSSNERGMVLLESEYEGRASPPDQRRSGQADRRAGRCPFRHPTGGSDALGRCPGWPHLAESAIAISLRTDGLAGLRRLRRSCALGTSRAASTSGPSGRARTVLSASAATRASSYQQRSGCAEVHPLRDVRRPRPPGLVRRQRPHSPIAGRLASSGVRTGRLTPLARANEDRSNLVKEPTL